MFDQGFFAALAGQPHQTGMDWDWLMGYLRGKEVFFRLNSMEA